MGCSFLLQRIFPTQGSNPHLLRWKVSESPGKPYSTSIHPSQSRAQSPEEVSKPPATRAVGMALAGWGQMKKDSLPGRPLAAPQCHEVEGVT